MNDTFIINGGKPLIGEVVLSGAKNASVKLLIASLLFNSPVTLQGVPINNDNQELLHLFNEIGVKTTIQNGDATVDPTGISKHTVSMLYGSKIRSSFLLFGPLLRRFGEAHIPNPGGCRIGARPIDRIIKGISHLGVGISYNHDTGYYDASLDTVISGEYTFAKPTHTGTESMILLAVCGVGHVVLHNCALEPEIDDLISFLNEGGARISRNERSISIQGVKVLSQVRPHRVITDRNEAVTYASMAYVTGGDVLIPNIHAKHIAIFIDKIREAGGKVDVLGEVGVRFTSTGRLKATNIETAPHPGYMTDWQPQWGLMMALAEGESVVHETILESRLNYVQELEKVGAQIAFFQPEVENPNELYQFDFEPSKELLQAVRITGVEKLHNGVMVVHDLRAGAVVVMAGLSAQGESYIHGASQIERGYEQIVDKISNLGGDIRKV